jgi:hypothetical protein
MFTKEPNASILSDIPMNENSSWFECVVFAWAVGGILGTWTNQPEI